MPDSAAVMGFIPTRDFQRARAFYVDLLGLKPISQDDFALEVISNGTHIRITKVGEFTPFPFTVCRRTRMASGTRPAAQGSPGSAIPKTTSSPSRIIRIEPSAFTLVPPANSGQISTRRASILIQV
jgi:catechol 2,3-dioxygenase-like lactoylglutathione lyase family enzyme